MKYTIRYAHLEKAPLWKTGDTIIRGDIIGIMGSTGQSSGPHLHIDCTEGENKYPFVISDMESGRVMPCKKQLDYFIDDELFSYAPYITTQYDDADYHAMYKKWHKGYDVVPLDRHRTKEHFAIHWNRSFSAKVINVLWQPKSYGHCIYLCMEV